MILKTKYNHNIKKALFLAVLLVLCLPYLQKTFNICEEAPLGGVIANYEPAEFTLETWLNGEYQKKTEEYYKNSFGFRNTMIRINNQKMYSLYNIAKANGAIVGKNGYLYEKSYIDAYTGKDFIGVDSIQRIIYKIKKVQDTLKTKNIDLIIIYAPGKASFYPEFIPDFYLKTKKKITNYKVFVDESRKNKLNFIDFNQWFIRLKKTTKYPLFPKTGIHWSKYGELLAADSIIKYIEQIKNIKLPQITILDTELSDTARGDDKDIEKGMNLLFNLRHLKMAYPSIQINKNNVSLNTKVLTISDSYYWGMFNLGLSKDIFAGGRFWYYNQQIYPDSYDKLLNVSDVDILSEVEKNSVIILMSTDANLYKFPFGFIDQLYEAYFPREKYILDSSNSRVMYYIDLIKKTPEWLSHIETQASKNNISIEKAIKDNAEYMAWKEKNEKNENSIQNQ